MKSAPKKQEKFGFVKASELIKKLNDENDKNAQRPSSKAKNKDAKNPK